MIPLSQHLYAVFVAAASTLQQELEAYIDEINLELDFGLALENPRDVETQINDEFYTPPQVFPAIRVGHAGSRVHKELGNQGRRRDKHRLRITLYLADQRRLVPDATLANSDVQTALGLSSAAFLSVVQACLQEKMPGQSGIEKAAVEAYEIKPPEQTGQLGIVQISELIMTFVQTVRSKHGPN